MNPSTVILAGRQADFAKSAGHFNRLACSILISLGILVNMTRSKDRLAELHDKLPELAEKAVKEVKRTTSSPAFKSKPPREKLREAVSAAVGPFRGQLPGIEKFVEELRKTGLADDPVYVGNALNGLETRIYRGDVADTTHPDCVAVASANRFFCSGTLIAPQLVLTAGHCASEETIKYVMFGADVAAPLRRVVAVRENGSRLANGFVYTNTVLQRDLLLLVLEEKVTEIAPRKLALSSEIKAASEAWIAGFGTNDSGGTTGYGIRRFGGPAFLADPTIARFGADSETELVLGRHPLGLDTCRGDSGGPLYLDTPAGRVLAGVTSRPVRYYFDQAGKFRRPDTVCGAGGIYTRVDVFLSWINEVADAFQVERPQSR
jgi:V8-like Glu-specific endopeptidase